MKIAVTMKAMILSIIAVLEKVFQLWQILDGSSEDNIESDPDLSEQKKQFC